MTGSTSGSGGRTSTSAKQRLRKKLEARSKLDGREAGSVEEDSVCSLQPPTNPDVLEILQEAGALFPKSQSEATRLYRLAAQKGYIPAFVLLANHARKANDEPLVIESLFSLLLHEEAPQQIPAGILQTYAGDLVMLLRHEKHATAKSRHKQDIDKLSHTWPMFNELEHFREAQDVMSSIKSLMLKSQIEELTAQASAADYSELLSQAPCTSQPVLSTDLSTGKVNSAQQAFKQSAVSASEELHTEGCATSTSLAGEIAEYAKLVARVKKSCNGATSTASGGGSHDGGITSTASVDGSNNHAELLALVRKSCNVPTVKSEAAINMMD